MDLHLLSLYKHFGMEHLKFKYWSLLWNSNQYARIRAKNCIKAENNRNLNGNNFSVILKCDLTEPWI